MRLLAVLLALLLAVPAAAQTPEERARLDWAVTRGRLLFEVDRAAWVTTDDMRERLSQADQQRVRGWTVERDGTGFAVTYFTHAATARRSSRALSRPGRESPRRVARNLPSGRAGRSSRRCSAGSRMARRLISLTQYQDLQRDRPNLAVIPPDSLDAPMDVYVLTPQTQAGIYPFGGH